MEYVVLSSVLLFVSVATCLSAIEFDRNGIAIASGIVSLIGMLIPDYLSTMVSKDTCLILVTATITLELVFLLRVVATVLYKYLTKKQKAKAKTHTIRNHN